MNNQKTSVYLAFIYDQIFSKSIHVIIFFQIFNAIEICNYTIDVIIFICPFEKFVSFIICDYNSKWKFDKVQKLFKS